MSQYMLLIRGDDSPELSPAEMQSIVQEYVAWAGRLRTENQLVDANELAAGGKIVRGTGSASRVTDGPFTESKEVVGGYFLIQAESEEEATRIAAACPGLRRGGAVEVRTIVDHSGG